jgi:hypothetical protein
MELIMSQSLKAALPEEISGSSAEVAAGPGRRGRIWARYHTLNKAKVLMARDRWQRVGRQRADNIWTTWSTLEAIRSQGTVAVELNAGL